MLEWVDAFTAVVMAFFLRLGVPLVLTAILVWWLRRLDLRWQSEAEELHRIQLAHAEPQTPCWKVKSCSPERRATCAAYQHNEKPCWQVMRGAEGRLPDRCLTCTVFSDAPVPQKVSVGGGE